MRENRYIFVSQDDNVRELETSKAIDRISRIKLVLEGLKHNATLEAKPIVSRAAEFLENNAQISA